MLLIEEQEGWRPYSCRLCSEEEELGSASELTHVLATHCVFTASSVKSTKSTRAFFCLIEW